VPVTPRKGGRGTRPRPSGPAAAPDPQDLARQAHDLYERAADPAVTTAQIDGLVGQLGGLKKAGLVTVAEAVGLKGMKAKTNEEIIQAIRQRIVSRKGAAQRAGLIDRPVLEEPATPATGTPVGPEGPAAGED
jgi:hypothetical protein